MSKTILQINYKITTSVADHMPIIEPAAEPIAAVPGLLWKVWLHNDEQHEMGGIYLFGSLENAQAYVQGPIVQGLVHPTITDVNVKFFGVAEDMSKITRAPLEATVSA